MADEYALVLKHRIVPGRTKTGRTEEVGGTKLTFLFIAGYVVPQGSGWYMAKSGSERRKGDNFMGSSLWSR